MSSPLNRLSALVGELWASGDLRPEWRDPFMAVPRHLFVPSTVWLEDGDSLVPVHKSRMARLARRGGHPGVVLTRAMARMGAPSA